VGGDNQVTTQFYWKTQTKKIGWIVELLLDFLLVGEENIGILFSFEKKFGCHLIFYSFGTEIFFALLIFVGFFCFKGN
jgi:hypothetical protein